MTLFNVHRRYYNTRIIAIIAEIICILVWCRCGCCCFYRSTATNKWEKIISICWCGLCACASRFSSFSWRNDKFHPGAENRRDGIHKIWTVWAILKPPRTIVFVMRSCLKVKYVMNKAYGSPSDAFLSFRWMLEMFDRILQFICENIIRYSILEKQSAVQSWTNY